MAKAGIIMHFFCFTLMLVTNNNKAKCSTDSAVILFSIKQGTKRLTEMKQINNSQSVSHSVTLHSVKNIWTSWYLMLQVTTAAISLWIFSSSIIFFSFFSFSLTKTTVFVNENHSDLYSSYTSYSFSFFIVQLHFVNRLSKTFTVCVIICVTLLFICTVF